MIFFSQENERPLIRAYFICLIVEGLHTLPTMHVYLYVHIYIYVCCVLLFDASQLTHTFSITIFFNLRSLYNNVIQSNWGNKHMDGYSIYVCVGETIVIAPPGWCRRVGIISKSRLSVRDQRASQTDLFAGNCCSKPANQKLQPAKGNPLWLSTCSSAFRFAYLPPTAWCYCTAVHQEGERTHPKRTTTTAPRGQAGHSVALLPLSSIPSSPCRAMQRK